MEEEVNVEDSKNYHWQLSTVCLTKVKKEVVCSETIKNNNRYWWHLNWITFIILISFFNIRKSSNF